LPPLTVGSEITRHRWNGGSELFKAVPSVIMTRQKFHPTGSTQLPPGASG
jgi:hypothetical protein